MATSFVATFHTESTLRKLPVPTTCAGVRERLASVPAGAIDADGPMTIIPPVPVGTTLGEVAEFMT
jgi:hypothetical protein